MILTVTMNPSVDISYPVSQLEIDKVNRCSHPIKSAGGKGLNVTRVIHQMGYPVRCTGLLGGTLGVFIEERLNKLTIKHDFLSIKEETRNCVAILEENGNQTEILETGPVVSETELAQFNELLIQLEKHHNVITLSGSLPKGAPVDYYVTLLQNIHSNATKVILDTSGESLKSVLKAKVKPYAIKPNMSELEELLDQKISMDNTILKEVLKDEMFFGIPLILVSLGAKGAFVKYYDEFYDVTIPAIPVVNPVGSGDSTVAGLAIGVASNQSIEDIIKTSMALGLLNTMEKKTGYVNKDKYCYYRKQVIVEKI